MLNAPGIVRELRPEVYFFHTLWTFLTSIVNSWTFTHVVCVALKYKCPVHLVSTTKSRGFILLVDIFDEITSCHYLASYLELKSYLRS